MCMFCAAVPTIAVAGIGMQVQQQKERRAAEGRGEKPPKPKLPAGPVTVVVVGSLFVIATIIHSQNYL